MACFIDVQILIIKNDYSTKEISSAGFNSKCKPLRCSAFCFSGLNPCIFCLLKKLKSFTSLLHIKAIQHFQSSVQH